MKCEWVRQNVVFYAYDELADDARFEFEQHITRCADCAAELKATQEMRQRLATFPVTEPTPNLLASSRMRLQESLESAKQGGWWQRLVFDPGVWLREIRFAPALTAAIFVVGFAGGIGTTYKVLRSNQHLASIVQPAAPSQPVEASISGIRSVTQEPGTNQVSIKYDTVSTQETQGSLNDQRIQQLLLFAARSNYNSGVRMDSVGLLTQQTNDDRVREALIYALRYDSNPGVRLKALDGLSGFVKDDVRVRNAMLEALLNDSNPGVRFESLHLLEPVRADSSVRIVLQKLAKTDKNDFIRTQARTVLADAPQMD
jgi:anti-sigma factor RsiW